jgi:hypothetical protein
VQRRYAGVAESCQRLASHVLHGRCQHCGHFAWTPHDADLFAASRAEAEAWVASKEAAVEAAAEAALRAPAGGAGAPADGEGADGSEVAADLADAAPAAAAAVGSDGAPLDEHAAKAMRAVEERRAKRARVRARKEAAGNK